MEMFCRYMVEEERVSELDIKWYLDSSPSPWLVHLPHHWTVPHIVRGSRLAGHVSQVFSNRSLTVVSLTRLRSTMSGVYTCKVSTNTQETVSRARLQILSKSEIFTGGVKPGKLRQFSDYFPVHYKFLVRSSQFTSMSYFQENQRNLQSSSAPRLLTDWR